MKRMFVIAALIFSAHFAHAFYNGIENQPITHLRNDDGEVVFSKGIIIKFKRDWSFHPNEYQVDNPCSSGRGACVRAGGSGITNSNEADEIVRYANDTNTITLILKNEYLSLPESSDVFISGKMVIGENVPISADVANYMGLGQSDKIISIGEYLIAPIANTDRFKVKLPIR